MPFHPAEAAQRPKGLPPFYWAPWKEPRDRSLKRMVFHLYVPFGNLT